MTHKQSGEELLPALFCRSQTSSAAAKWTIRRHCFSKCCFNNRFQIHKWAPKLILMKGCVMCSWHLKLLLLFILEAWLRSVISGQPQLLEECVAGWCTGLLLQVHANCVNRTLATALISEIIELMKDSCTNGKFSQSSSAPAPGGFYVPLIC